MRHGLYDPEAGYYAAGRVRFGHGADFWTFPTRLAPAFGQLLAEHLAGLRARLVDAGDLAADAPFDVVELGAGTGALARDIVRAAQAMAQAPEPYAGLARTLRYRIGERAPALRQAQATLLAGLPVTHLPQTADDATAALEPMVGVILHNELLDVWPHALLRPSTSERLRLAATPAGQGEAIPRAALVPRCGRRSRPARQRRRWRFGRSGRPSPCRTQIGSKISPSERPHPQKSVAIALA